jgi:hypothetical protein
MEVHTRRAGVPRLYALPRLVSCGITAEFSDAGFINVESDQASSNSSPMH